VSAPETVCVTGPPLVLPVMDEPLDAHASAVETGRVHVRKAVHGCKGVRRDQSHTPHRPVHSKQDWRELCCLSRHLSVVYANCTVGVYHAMALTSLNRRMTDMATSKKRSPTKPTAKPRASRREQTGAGRSAGLQKAVRPSPELAALVGPGPLPRTEITKKLWEYIKSHGLQDAQNKRQIRADARLEPIFGGKQSVSMFELAKLVSQHVQ
jgi:upstream activation factor subunit UAF30